MSQATSRPGVLSMPLHWLSEAAALAADVLVLVCGPTAEVEEANRRALWESARGIAEDCPAD